MSDYDGEARSASNLALERIERLEAILHLAGIGADEEAIALRVAAVRKRENRLVKIRQRKIWNGQAKGWMKAERESRFWQNFRRIRADLRAKKSGAI